MASDDGKRLSDAVNLHIVAKGDEANSKFIACNLSDGSTDATLYDSWDDARRHHPEYHCYVRIFPTGMTPEEGDACLKYWRGVYRMGGTAMHPDKWRVMQLRKAVNVNRNF